MKTLLSALLFGLFAAVATNAVRAADDAKFDNHGLTFNHPKDWTVKADAKRDATTITADNGKGSSVMITLQGSEVDPKTLTDIQVKAYKKAFEGKVVKDSEKPIKRKVLGSEREGHSLEVKLFEGVTMKLEHYAFQT